jgi:anion-transporting  ArsA/GET3 family ATPase
MFEDVAQMEKEIETFRKNVVASSELIEGIFQLSDATKRQRESFSSSAEELLKKIDSCIKQIRLDHEAALRTLSDNNEAAIASLQHNMIEEQENRLKELRQIQNALENLQAAYVDKLHQTETTIQGYQTEAEQKYNDFVRRLESTNVDQIFKEVQELKSSVKAKFAILLGGIGITLVVTILNLILR